VILCISNLNICVPYAVGMFLLVLLMLDKTGKQLIQPSRILQYRTKMEHYISNVDELFMNKTKHLNVLTYNGTQFNNTNELLN
jgi:hypothetical protein